VRALLSVGCYVRALVRDEAKAASLAAGAELTCADFGFSTVVRPSNVRSVRRLPA
jgi:uncharacterized protein YbjT (DUF2867 family)